MSRWVAFLLAGALIFTSWVCWEQNQTIQQQRGWVIAMGRMVDRLAELLKNQPICTPEDENSPPEPESEAHKSMWRADAESGPAAPPDRPKGR